MSTAVDEYETITVDPVGWCTVCETPFYSWGLPRECVHKRLKAGYLIFVDAEAKTEQGAEFWEKNAADKLTGWASFLHAVPLGEIQHKWVQDPHGDDWIT